MISLLFVRVSSLITIPSIPNAEQDCECLADMAQRLYRFLIDQT